MSGELRCCAQFRQWHWPAQYTWTAYLVRRPHARALRCGNFFSLAAMPTNVTNHHRQSMYLVWVLMTNPMTHLLSLFQLCPLSLSSSPFPLSLEYRAGDVCFPNFFPFILGGVSKCPGSFQEQSSQLKVKKGIALPPGCIFGLNMLRAKDNPPFLPQLA